MHILNLILLHPAGGSRIGGGRWPTWEQSSSINRSHNQSYTLFPSITFLVDWHWSPMVRMGLSSVTGTRCSFRITPAEYVITKTGQGVGANSSTSTHGPWYGRQTIPVTLKRHNVHRGVHCGSWVHTGLFHIRIVHTVFADTPKTVKLTLLCNQWDVWDEPNGSFYNEQYLRFCASF